MAISPEGVIPSTSCYMFAFRVRTRDFGVGRSNGAISGLTKSKTAAHIPDMFLIIKFCTFLISHPKNPRKLHYALFEEL